MPVPTPRDLHAKPGPRQRIPVPRPPQPPPAYQPVTLPARWEHLLRRSGLGVDARRVGMVLTGYADPATGALGDQTPSNRHLAKRMPMNRSDVLCALSELEREGWISRPPMLPGPGPHPVRPLTLTIPAHLQEPTS